MRNFPILAMLVSALFLCSCISSHQIIRHEGTRSGAISKSDSILIITPQDAVAVDDSFPNSGIVVARRLAEALTPKVSRVAIAGANASKSGFTRVIEPSILQWEDHATAWSGIPDKVTISLAVAKAPSGEHLDSTILKAKSSWWTLGGDHPEKLLPLMFQDYANTIR